MGQRDLDLSCRKGNNYRFPKHEAGRQVTWKSDVAASRVHLMKRCTSTTVVTEPEATASMMARDMPMLPAVKQLSMGIASACM